MACFFNELCANWSKSKSSLSDIISKYVESGLIRRCECAEDKRNQYVAMTPEALEVKRGLTEICNELNNMVFETYSAEEAVKFISMVDEILERGKKIL